jgi:hypothetical protein
VFLNNTMVIDGLEAILVYAPSSIMRGAARAKARPGLRRHRDRKQSWGFSPGVEQGSGAAFHLTPEQLPGQLARSRKKGIG